MIKLVDEELKIGAQNVELANLGSVLVYGRRAIVGFTSGADAFSRPPRARVTIGVPGTTSFGVATDISDIQSYLAVTHTASASVINHVPATAAITRLDPFADATATGFTFDGDSFPLPVDGYSIGIAGEEHFGIAFDLDDEVAIIDPIHTASLSVM